MNEHFRPEHLEEYSFLWSIVRLIIASIALFIGGVPPVFLLVRLLPFTAPLIGSLLQLAWVISGAAVLYLFFRWNSGGKLLFGGKNQKDLVTFFVMIVSGINLGLTGMLGNNIGMSMSSNKILFFVVGLLYLYSAWHLYTRWKGHGRKLI